MTQVGLSRLVSVGFHLALAGLALIPWTPGLPVRPKLKETAIALYIPSDMLVHKPLLLPSRPQGGGGGGNHQLTPASLGVLPRAADKQLVPPDPEPAKNVDPVLVVEPTIVAPELAVLRPLNLLNIGDPNGIVGPPSSGPGKGGGMGGGNGHGVGDSDGPGTGPGSGGGCCDGTYRVGGDVKAPVVIYRVEPEYSEEARKARYQGTVVLEAVIRKDGTVDVLHLVRSLGFGLDQNAIEALRRWRFRPATKNGTAVDSTLNIEVRFNLR
jgi:protein TonB